MSSSCRSTQFEFPEVIFYSQEFEEALLQHFLVGESPKQTSVPAMDFSSTLSADFVDPLDLWEQYQPSIEDYASRPFDLVDPEPVVKAEVPVIEPVVQAPEPTFVRAKKEQPSSRPAPYTITKPSRRGRPVKVSSTSKMANYARSYREMKKFQLEVASTKVAELEEENSALRQENQELRDGFELLREEVTKLRQMMAEMPNSAPSFRQPVKKELFY